MPLFQKLDQFHLSIRSNRWHSYFYLFCRLSLALGFVIAGMVKILGERFASGLSEIHPMGTYLVALYHTGFYYPMIGVAQVIAAVLLLLHRTTLLGAMIYFPIILNIWMLSIAVRFDGSYVSSTLMVLANLYLLAYNYDRWKMILAGKKSGNFSVLEVSAKNSKFPLGFFGFVTGCIISVIVVFQFAYEVMPKNSHYECLTQFDESELGQIGKEFCECVHRIGKPLDQCLENFELSKKLTRSNPDSST